MIQLLYLLSKKYPHETIFHMYQLYILHVNDLAHNIFVPSQIIKIHHLKTVSLSLPFVPNVLITDKKAISVFINTVPIFGCLLYNLPPITARDRKQVFPILYFCGIFLFLLGYSFLNVNNIILLSYYLCITILKFCAS